MPDHYNNFQELNQHQHLEIDYRIHSVAQPHPLVILAIHAGGIELGTSELALAIAGNDYSIYLFEGLRKGKNERLHLTSTHFDEPQCLDLVQKHQHALSIHGFTANPSDPEIYLGGTHQLFIQHMLQSLQTNGYLAQVNTQKFGATDPRNICNRTQNGMGLQIEIAGGLRQRFFSNYFTHIGRKTITPHFTHFVQIIRQTLEADQYLTN
ncbi:MAG: poly-gamma-glutamate hydrolase family protein [Chloroflexota bacterium]